MAQRRSKQAAPSPAPADRPSDDPKELRKAAEAQRRQQVETLRKHRLPMDAEPAFAFKP